MKKLSEMVERVANVEAASKHKAYVIRINKDWYVWDNIHPPTDIMQEGHPGKTYAIWRYTDWRGDETNRKGEYIDVDDLQLTRIPGNWKSMKSALWAHKSWLKGKKNDVKLRAKLEKLTGTDGIMNVRVMQEIRDLFGIEGEDEATERLGYRGRS